MGGGWWSSPAKPSLPSAPAVIDGLRQALQGRQWVAWPVFVVSSPCLDLLCLESLLLVWRTMRERKKWSTPYTAVNIHDNEETSAAVTQIEEIINLFSNFLWKMHTLFLAQHILLSEFYFLHMERCSCPGLIWRPRLTDARNNPAGSHKPLQPLQTGRSSSSQLSDAHSLQKRQ